jgi:acyl carrier protein
LQDDEPLFGETLGLDSIDALELSVLMEREYGIKITDPAEGRKILYDVNSMAAHILANKPTCIANDAGCGHWHGSYLRDWQQSRTESPKSSCKVDRQAFAKRSI